jgi:PKD repeat protein
LNKFRLNLAVVLLLLAASVPAFGQFYPLPASSSEPAAICTNCNGYNASGQPNSGLPMFPYSLPINDHVGRLVDSANMIDTTDGMRTARAGKVRYAPPKGSFPGRVYVQLGATIGAYSANTFFSSTLPAGMQPVSKISTGRKYSRNPLERITPPDAFVYPESTTSGWKLYNSDGNDRLYDFDVDDRGYVYAAYSIFGWGIMRDDGTKTGVTQLPLTQQWIEANEVPFGPKLIFTIKAGNEYYTVVSAGGISDSSSVAVYNTTNPANKTSYSSLSGKTKVFFSWAKSPDLSRVAIIDGNYGVRIYDARQYVTGGSSLHDTTPTGSAKFLSVTSDGEGSFWALQSSVGSGPAKLFKFAPAGGGYEATSYDIPNSGGFTAQLVDGGDGYIGVGGYIAGAGDIRLFKVSGGTPVELDLKGFFRNYYHRAPDGYAEPESRINPRAIRPIEYDGKTYLIYSAFGLGDVYQLQVGESVTAKMEPASGEFYGDDFVFSASTSTSEFPLNVLWDFGNPESGTANEASSRTGSSVHHRFSGLTTANAINAAKKVTVKLATDPAVKDQVSVSLKVPQARVKVVATGVAIANNAELIFGDQFADNSDGQPAGHYNVWTLDGADETLASTATKGAGGLGSHSVKLAAKYGPQNSTTPVFTSLVGPLNYKVLPFLATLKTPTKSGSAVTFGATGRYTSDITVLPAITQWDTLWTLKTSTGADVVPPQAKPDAIGSVPNFVVTQTIPEGAVLTLTVSVPTAGLPAGTAAFASYTTSTTIDAPVNPTITPAGCANTGSPCTLTATPAGTSNWDKVEWVVKLGSVTKFSGTGTTVDIASKLDAVGTYAVTLTVSRSIFTKTATANLNVAGALCNGTLPTSSNMALGVYGNTSGCAGSACTAGETLTFRAEAWNYDFQPCDRFIWTFGDGSSQTTTTPETTKVYSGNGPFNATLKIQNSATGATSAAFPKTVTFGTVVEPPPPPQCNAPVSVNISYGSVSCTNGNGQPCKTGEVITFTATKNGATAQSCDNVTWDFGAAGTGTGRSTTKIFSSAGTYNVTATVQNVNGTVTSSPRTVIVSQGNTDPGCSLTPRNISVKFTGLQSGCSFGSTNACRQNETVRFEVDAFNYDIQACDTFLWSFDDGSANATTRTVDHVFPGNKDTFNVTLKVKNSNGEVNVSATVRVEGANVPATPVLSLTGPATAGKNSTVTFSATSDIANSTGWAWEFNDGTGVDNSQNAHVGSSNSVSHTFTSPGTYTVRVQARNAAAGATGSRGQATRQIVITDVPEHRFVLPVVTHDEGVGGSAWRTDVQVYNPDPTVSASNPMTMKVTFKGSTQTITVPQATVIFEDFMTRFTSGKDLGPMIVSVTGNYQPQIWTRTYNQTAGGTYGQFIPAMLLSGDGSGGAGNEAPKYYVAGLRHNARYRTNIGFVNPNTSNITVTGTVYEAEKGIAIGTFTKTLEPFKLEQTNIQALLNRTDMPDRPFSIEVEAPAGKWVIAYASFVDNRTGDPTYLQAVRGGELASADYKEGVLPGVGRIGSWRSDVTVFNPDTKGVSLELSYYDQTGALKKKTGGITLGSLEMLQLDDLLRTSQVNVDGESLGSLRLRVETTNNGHYPLVFARTYFDAPTGSYGQGITGVAAKRANVKVGKPGIIPAVRSTEHYYTNIGLTNVTDKPATVRVTLLDPDTGAAGLTETYELAAYQSIVRSPSGGVDIIKALSPNSVRASFRIEVIAGTGEVWAYASNVDKRTFDPEYIAAIPAQ